MQKGFESKKLQEFPKRVALSGRTLPVFVILSYLMYLEQKDLFVSKIDVYACIFPLPIPTKSKTFLNVYRHFTEPTKAYICSCKGFVILKFLI